MNWNVIEANWKQFTGRVKETWRKLTNGQLDMIAGKRDQLPVKAQELNGVDRDEAARQIQSFEDSEREFSRTNFL